MDFREVIIALIVFATVYGIFLAWKIRHLTPNDQKKKATTPRAHTFYEPGLNAPDNANPQNFYNNAPHATDLADLANSSDTVDLHFSPKARTQQTRQKPYSYEPSHLHYSYGSPNLNLQPSHLSSRIDALEHQMVLLRQNIVELRAQLARATESTAQEMERLRNRQTVSPMYNEALRLVQAGYNTQEVAKRCGISLAEADMVSVLARNQEGWHNGRK